MMIDVNGAMRAGTMTAEDTETVIVMIADSATTTGSVIVTTGGAFLIATTAAFVKTISSGSVTVTTAGSFSAVTVRSLLESGTGTTAITGPGTAIAGAGEAHAA
jgi:hypothetical protein